MQTKFDVSERRVCRVLDQPRSTQPYEVEPPSDEEAICRRLREIVRRRPRFGYRRLTAVLRREGFAVNFKRVHRLCRREGLGVRRTTRKKRAIGASTNACHVRRAERTNLVWCWDLAFGRTTNGTAFKWLSIVDEYTSECVALEVARSQTSEDVIDALATAFAVRGAPEAIRSDNGPEFVAEAIQEWLKRPLIEGLYVAPGSPCENRYAESFHSTLADELSSREEFENVTSAKKQTAAWRDDYNHARPHSSLG